MADQLTFNPRAESDLFGKVAGAENGHAVATINLTLTDNLSKEVRPAVPLKVHLMGPAEAAGLQPSAVVHTAPKAWSRDAETTKLAHIDFAEIDLPWRYSFDRTGQVKPWIVLITGTTDELELVGGGVKVKQDAVFKSHDLSESWKWAHEMEDGGRKVARLVSPRGLEVNPAGLLPNREYLAVVVPAYTVSGGQVIPAWDANKDAVVRRPDGNVLPAYYAWHYWTADAGDFQTLAALLHAVEVGGLGRARLAYERLAPPAVLEVRGAIASLAPKKDTVVAPLRGLPTTWPIATDPAPAPVLADFDALNVGLSDPRRPVIGLPTYGLPWIAEPKDTDWGRLLNGDPRFRGIGGLGAWLAMEAQQELIDAARQQVGALAEASQRVRQVSMGLKSARSLWTRRLPDDPVQQLFLFGPTLRRLPASDGAQNGLSALDVVTGGDRSLPSAALSTAARRLLRSDDGIAKYAQPGAAGRAAVLQAASDCPPLPSLPGGHVDNLLRGIDARPLGELLGVGMSGRPPDELHLPDGVQLHDEGRFLGQTVGRHSDPLARRCRLVDLAELGRRVGAAISPMGARPPILVRVCGSVTGIDICNLEPPEVCIGLNYEVWKLLKKKAKSWLLPGIESLEKNAVVAMETNPAFVEALLVGLNTQLLAELRWHNLAIAPKCTPLRWFWGNFDYKTDTRVDDIHGIDLWKDTRLGHAQHQVLTAGDQAGNRDLAMVFRTDLFRRYPSTLVYLTKMADDAALKDEQPDFKNRRAIPARMKGTVGDDVTFFIFDIDPSTLSDYRVVLDEPPAELRFRNTLGSAGDTSARFATNVIDTPVRVAIDGTYLSWKGLPPA